MLGVTTGGEQGDSAIRTRGAGITKVLATADPKLKAEVYEELSVSITYEPDRRVVIAQATPV